MNGSVRRGLLSLVGAMLALAAAVAHAQPPDPEMLFRQGEMLAQRGMWVGAQARYEAALRLAPDHAGAQVGLAESRAAQSDPGAAEMLRSLLGRGLPLALHARAQAALDRASATAHSPAADARARAEFEAKLEELREAEILQRREVLRLEEEVKDKQSRALIREEVRDQHLLRDVVRGLGWMRIYDTKLGAEEVTPVLRDAIRYYQQRAGLAADGQLSQALRERIDQDVAVVMDWAGTCFGNGDHPAIREYDATDPAGHPVKVRGYQRNPILGHVAMSTAIIWHKGATARVSPCVGCNFKVCLAPPPQIVIRSDYGYMFKEGR